MKGSIQSVKGIVLGLLIVVGISVASAGTYSGPNETAPGGNAEAPINVGSSLQVKNGSLGVNAFTALQNSYFAQNVGIGDTTNDGSLKLDVEGAVGATEYCDETGTNCVDASQIGGGLPSGAVMSFNLSSCPTGWKVSDGTNGTRDLRGVFVRGLSNGSTTDYGRTLGSYQADGIENHSHQAGYTSIKQGTNPGYGAMVNYSQITARVSTTNNTGGIHETRPINVALLYCQKI